MCIFWQEVFPLASNVKDDCMFTIYNFLVNLLNGANKATYFKRKFMQKVSKRHHNASAG